jgi:hypothetical protein
MIFTLVLVVLALSWYIRHIFKKAGMAKTPAEQMREELTQKLRSEGHSEEYIKQSVVIDDLKFKKFDHAFGY